MTNIPFFPPSSQTRACPFRLQQRAAPKATHNVEESDKTSHLPRVRLLDAGGRMAYSSKSPVSAGSSRDSFQGPESQVVQEQHVLVSESHSPRHAHRRF